MVRSTYDPTSPFKGGVIFGRRKNSTTYTLIIVNAWLDFSLQIKNKAKGCRFFVV